MKLEVIRSVQAYRELCRQEKTIPLFSQAWWLDALAGADNWGVVIALKGDSVMGAHPYVIKRRLGMRILRQPQLTQNLGPWIKPSDAKYAKALSQEKDILGALAEALPPHDIYRQNWHYTRQNWLPFYWRGYKQTTQYTYRLALAQNGNMLWKGFNENIRREIRKAQNRFNVIVRPAMSVGEFLSVNEKTFQRQGRVLPYTIDLVNRLDQATTERGARDILVAEDPEGNIHAGVYIVRDADTAYYLMGGGDPLFRNSGAGSLCMWEAIKYQPDNILAFDFEGSMLEPVERFFRAFGAAQTPYFQVTRMNSRRARLAEQIRVVTRGIF